MPDIERLFHEYHAPLVRYLTRRLGDRDWAEEIAQETFVRAMRQDVITSERSWLFAVATNLVRDEMRKDARRRQKLERLVEEAKAREAEVQPLPIRSEEHTSELQSRQYLVCRLLLEKKHSARRGRRAPTTPSRTTMGSWPRNPGR